MIPPSRNMSIYLEIKITATSIANGGNRSRYGQAAIMESIFNRLPQLLLLIDLPDVVNPIAVAIARNPCYVVSMISI